ncbi:MAG TPA: glycosyltransferase 87 family protein [Gaiellaceae bacterium]
MTRLAIAAVGIAVFAAASALPNVRMLDRGNLGDTPVYKDYGEQMRDGKVPYRDFFVEYPPGALPVFVAPTVGESRDYTLHSQALQWLLGAAAIVAVAFTLDALGAGRRATLAAVVALALAPALLGQVTFTRYDFWPAVLTAAALLAFVRDRSLLGAGALAIAVAAKEYPIVILPLALLYVWHRGGRSEALRLLAVFCVVLAAILLPFAALGPGGVRYSLYVQFRRPLQIESLGGSLLLAAHQLGLYTPHVVSTYGSQNLAGAVPDALAALTTVVGLVAIVAVWVLFARGPRQASDLLTASAAAVVAFVAFGKVLSPQYVIWLLALVAVVDRRARVRAFALLAAALALTQGWSQGHYHDVVQLRPLGWVVLVRNVVLVALYAVLFVAVAGGRYTSKSRVSIFR